MKIITCSKNKSVDIIRCQPSSAGIFLTKFEGVNVHSWKGKL